jgi:hypothetical protein
MSAPQAVNAVRQRVPDDMFEYEVVDDFNQSS